MRRNSSSVLCRPVITKKSEYLPESNLVEHENCFASEDYCCRCAGVTLRFAGKRAHGQSSQLADLRRF